MQTRTVECKQTSIHLMLPVYRLGCSASDALVLERQLARAAGVHQVYVNPVTEVAYVTYDPTQIDAEQIQAIVDRVGYGKSAGTFDRSTTYRSSLSPGRPFGCLRRLRS
jgi:cation transport ATPase